MITIDTINGTTDFKADYILSQSFKDNFNFVLEDALMHIDNVHKASYSQKSDNAYDIYVYPKRCRIAKLFNLNIRWDFYKRSVVIIIMNKSKNRQTYITVPFDDIKSSDYIDSLKIAFVVCFSNIY